MYMYNVVLGSASDDDFIQPPPKRKKVPKKKKKCASSPVYVPGPPRVTRNPPLKIESGKSNIPHMRIISYCVLNLL